MSISLSSLLIVIVEFDFNQLVNETYASSRVKGGLEKVSDGPGMIYRIIFSDHTYKILGVVSKNMRGESEIQKLEGKVHYFPTSSLELAETLWGLVGGRSFPKTESTLFNIGDPMENWWMMRGKGWFKIVFRNYGLRESRDGSQILLGFLGDSNVASIQFSRLKNLIGQVFSQIHMDVSEKAIHLKSTEKEAAALLELEEMEGLFRFGRLPSSLYKKVLEQSSPTSLYYLNELCTARTFWLEVLDRLSRELAG